MKYLDGTMLIYGVDGSEIVDSIIVGNSIEVNIIGELMEGCKFLQFLRRGGSEVLEGKVAAIYLNNYKTNLCVRGYYGGHFGDGDTILDPEEFEQLCLMYDVEVEWCKGV